MSTQRGWSESPFDVVEDDGSPYGGKDFVLWNPPMIDLADGSRRSTNSEATQVFAELLKRHTRTMTFVRSRRQAELIHVYARDQLKLTHPIVAKRISPYRASYLPEDRRRIERDLFEGRLLGLSTTNAMELGVDVGNLDATILTGYPGTIASAWQQAGRSGRGGERSLSVMVANNNPLDQYLMRHPESFFGKSHESARISPANPYIMKPHLICAAYEAPLTMNDTEFFGPELLWYADELIEDEYLHVRHSRWHLLPEVTYPAERVNIRSASGAFYTLVDSDTGAILETVSEETAFMQLHPGAIYLHQGESYLVKDLDLDSHTAYCSLTDAPYYTQVRDYTETRILNTYKSRQVGEVSVFLGEVNVSTHVVGFKRVKHQTEEVLGDEYVELPPQEYETTALWFTPDRYTLDRIHAEKLDLAGGLHAVEHAAIGLLPLFAMCDRNDIGGISLRCTRTPAGHRCSSTTDTRAASGSPNTATRSSKTSGAPHTRSYPSARARRAVHPASTRPSAATTTSRWTKRWRGWCWKGCCQTFQNPYDVSPSTGVGNQANIRGMGQDEGTEVHTHGCDCHCVDRGNGANLDSGSRRR